MSGARPPPEECLATRDVTRAAGPIGATRRTTSAEWRQPGAEQVINLRTQVRILSAEPLDLRAQVLGAIGR